MISRRHTGFTLIELLIVVTIVGILSAIAIPSYSNYVVKGSRSAAETQLLQLASLQEKIYLNSNAYAFSVTAGYDGSAAGGLGATSGLTTDSKYSFSMTDNAGGTLSAPSQTYTITATPVAGSSQASDGTISISDNGKRLWGTANW